MVHDGECLCGYGLWVYDCGEYALRSVVQSLGVLDPGHWIVRKMIENGDIVPTRITP